MGKFEGPLDHASFLAVKEALTLTLASTIEHQLRKMGDDAKGISWFSSCARAHVAKQKIAA